MGMYMELFGFEIKKQFQNVSYKRKIAPCFSTQIFCVSRQETLADYLKCEMFKILHLSL